MHTKKKLWLNFNWLNNIDYLMIEKITWLIKSWFILEKDFFLLDLHWFNDIEFNHIEHHDRTLKIYYIFEYKDIQSLKILFNCSKIIFRYIYFINRINWMLFQFH